MKTYLVKFINDLNLYSAIAGNVLDAAMVAIKENNLGYGINNVEMVSQKHVITGMLNSEY